MKIDKYNPNTNFLLYKSVYGDMKVDVLSQDIIIWIPQKKMAELFDVQRLAITKDLKNIFTSKELDEKVMCSILELTTQYGTIRKKILRNQTGLKHEQ